MNRTWAVMGALLILLIGAASFMYYRSNLAHVPGKSDSSLVAGYYAADRYGDRPADNNIFVTQFGNTIHISGYATYGSLNGDNVGLLDATTTVDAHGAAFLDLTDTTFAQGDSCYLYFMFADGAVTVHETNGGQACGFGNNVDFEGKFVKNSQVPATLPQQELP